jgi:ABC-type phosphate transport system substrate-binding protein
VQPLDVDLDSSARKTFYHSLLDKSPEEINAYWTRLTFSGRTKPPEALKGQVEVLERVANDPQVIGYVERALLSQGARANLARNVKVVMSLPD